MYTNYMKLYSWNVNGIRAVLNKGALQSFLDQHDPDILCLQETKAHREQVELDLPQYHEYFFSAVKKGYSGTAIFSKTKPLSIREGLPEDILAQYDMASDTYGHPNSEGRVIAAEYADYWVVTVYTPNSKNDLSRLELRHQHWDKAFLVYLKQLEATKPVLACGDLNVAHTEIDLARPKQNRRNAGFTDEEREGIQNLIDAGFADTFRSLHPEQLDAYTWWSHWGKARENNVGWRIDYWLASQSLMPRITAADIHPEQMGSDHCPVSIVL